MTAPTNRHEFWATLDHRPDPFIIGETHGRLFRCAKCHDVFHGDDWRERVTVKRRLRKWNYHPWCVP